MIRIVKMTFRVEFINDFKLLFEQRKHKIKNSEGCTSLTLLQDKNDARIFFTYSNWLHENNLEMYRTSQLFVDTWQTIKPWFDDTPQAWTLENIVQL